MADGIQAMVHADLEDDMVMVRHDAPTEEPIAVMVKEMERIANQFGDFLTPEPAGPDAFIQPVFDLFVL